MSLRRASQRLCSLGLCDIPQWAVAASSSGSTAASRSSAMLVPSWFPPYSSPCSLPIRMHAGGVHACHSSAQATPSAISSSAHLLSSAVYHQPAFSGGLGTSGTSAFLRCRIAQSAALQHVAPSSPSALFPCVQVRGNVKEAAVKAAAKYAATKGKEKTAADSKYIRGRRVALCAAGLAYALWLIKDLAVGATVTEYAYMDLAVDGQNVGRLILGLYGKTQPATVDNFMGLITHYKGIGYTGCPFHAVLKDQAIVGGDITNGDGSGGASIHGVFFGIESKYMKPERGTIGMVVDNLDRDCIGSQFYILAHTNPNMHKKCAVIGKVLKGLRIVDALVRLPTDNMQRPLASITIAACGQLSKEEVDAEMQTKTSSPLVVEHRDGTLHPQPVPAVYGSLR